MARRHYWQFLVTDEGNPIENAQISIYVAGSNDPVFVYTDEVGPTGTAAAPQTVTSRKGYFEFWIADSNEINGYPLNTKFKLAWAAPGVQTGYIDYVDVFSTSVAEVDITDTNMTKNKAVSNFLAKGWEDHKNSILYENNILQIHGMGAIDESQWDDTLSENTKLNRLVSNVLGNNWEGHANTIYNSTNDRWEYTIAGGPSTHADGIDGNPGNPHGIDFVDVTSTDTEKNRLISNELAKQWHDHRTDTGADDHPQYSLVNGTRKYTAGVGYSNSTIVNTVGSDDFITMGYIKGRHAKAIIEPSGTNNPNRGTVYQNVYYEEWTDNGDGTYGATFLHGINITYPIVIVWETLTKTVVQPVNIQWISDDQTRITVTSDTHHVVKVFGI